MKFLETLLHGCAKQGRILLIAGLLAGIFLENLTLLIKPLIPELVAAMLFLAAFRVGPKAAFGAAQDMRASTGLTLVFQLAIPITLYAAFSMFGWVGTLPTAMILMAAGASISGAPNLAIFSGHDPSAALRLLVIGTALLPLTVIPVFWVVPGLGEGLAVFAPAMRLFGVIALSACAGFMLRHFCFPRATSDTLRSADGLSAVAMMVVVLGLMSAVGPSLRNEPDMLAITLAAAFAINFGLQLLCFLVLRSKQLSDQRVAISIVAGNRNIALFLTALPASTTDPLLLFIGCYQIPMYLTPILMGRLYRSSKSPAQGDGT